MNEPFTGDVWMNQDVSLDYPDRSAVSAEYPGNAEWYRQDNADRIPRMVRNSVTRMMGNRIPRMMNGIMRDRIARMAGILFGKTGGGQRIVQRS